MNTIIKLRRKQKNYKFKISEYMTKYGGIYHAMHG